MLDKIRAAAQQTKQFVSDHQTPVAVVVTGAVSGGLAWKFSREYAVKGMVAQVTSQGFEWGYRMGELETEQLLVWNFLREKELLDEFKTTVLGHSVA